MSSTPPWEFWIDVGGTFTDCLAKSPDNRISTFKLLSSSTFKGEGHFETDAVQTKGLKAEDIVSKRLLLDINERPPQNFFKHFSLNLYDADRNKIASSISVRSSTGNRLDLDLVSVKEMDKGRIKKETHYYELKSFEESPVVGIRWLLGIGADECTGAIKIKLGTTKGTNALLEHKGAKTALVTTKGFKDLLVIGNQNRPRLFDLNIRRPHTLFTEVAELDERVDSAGKVLKPIDEPEVKAALSQLKQKGFESLAVCFLNAYLNQSHEDCVRKIANELGFEQVSCSSQLMPTQRMVARGDTAVVDAYLTPIIKSYIAAIKTALPNAEIQMMTSAGGLVSADAFVGKDSILSGPAGGVVGVAEVCRGANVSKAIGFDMGGTSTDVCKYDGEFERRYNMEFQSVDKDGCEMAVKIASPMLAIETVAAGGGSICWFDGIQLRVGPESAGADPGPACYGAGGPMTISDCNIFLGRLDPLRFTFPLDRKAVQTRLESIAQAMCEKQDTKLSLHEIAEGFLKIAAQNMGAPIKKISMAKGYDIRNYTLVSFGGAGAQHACELAQSLGIEKIIQHPFASILSAYGIGTADQRFFSTQNFQQQFQNKPEPETPAQSKRILDAFNKLQTELENKAGLDTDAKTHYHASIDIRYVGQDAVINTAFDLNDSLSKSFKDFADQHTALYGFSFNNRDFEIRALKMERVDSLPKMSTASQVEKEHTPPNNNTQPLWWDGTEYSAPCFYYETLKAGALINGPALIFSKDTATVVAPAWNAKLTGNGDIALSSDKTLSNISSLDTQYDPVNLGLFNGRFSSIAEQMGAVLQRTSLSVNVKERLDFSCAIFTAKGELVVNAPHIPVHLGAMGDTVKAVIDEMSPIKSGDVFISNDPYKGGSHLPDVTVVCPVFSKSGDILFFTGNRAHHSEIGGITPGSMPPHSKNLAEEGVLIKVFRLVEKNQQSEAALIKILQGGPYPSRAVQENLADIRAQIAANELGRQLLLDMCAHYGEAVTQAYMVHMRQSAANKMRQALAKVKEGRYDFRDQMDNGIEITVSIDVSHDEQGGKAKVDFSQSGKVDSGNLNANLAIVKSAVLYSFRCLINEDIPLNDGVLDPISIITASPSILSPPSHEQVKKMAAVVGGNVETSTRLVDVLLGALSLAAASQGSMNNFLFGRTAKDGLLGFGYYETICGGSGAGPGFDGSHAVHTHMTNTRITDPEVLEERYPVRVNEFSIRQGSGGHGEFTGGNGAAREFLFLEGLSVSLMTQRRVTSPFGLKGGQPGASGRNLLCKAGETEFTELPEMIQLDVQAGDRIRIETPGGGGYGAKVN